MGKKTKTKVEPWKAAKPYILDGLQNTQDTIANNRGNLNDITGALTGAVRGLSQKVNQPNPLLEQGQQFVSNTLNGDYLNSNPHTQQFLDNTRSDVTDNLNSVFSRSSQANGSRHSQILARELARAENEIQFGQYNQERANQMGALGMIPNLNEAQYSGYNALGALGGVAAEAPYAGINAQARNISAYTSPYSTTTQKQGFGNTLMNAALAGAQAYSGSDIRLKTTIKKIGEFADGLGLWEWNYKDGLPDGIKQYCPDGRQRGVMAHEVKRLRPWALGPQIDGFATVNYGAL